MRKRRRSDTKGTGSRQDGASRGPRRERDNIAMERAISGSTRDSGSRQHESSSENGYQGPTWSQDAESAFPFSNTLPDEIGLDNDSSFDQTVAMDLQYFDHDLLVNGAPDLLRPTWESRLFSGSSTTYASSDLPNEQAMTRMHHVLLKFCQSPLTIKR